VALTGGMEGALISEFLTKADDTTRSAFAQVGITAEGVKTYKPQDAHALFKDMHLKGFKLPAPAAVIQAAGKTVAERFKVTTQTPAPAPATPVLDRTARKEAIQQPERASIPRTPTGQPAPRTETQRATDARAEMRGTRRAGSPR
jgi:hypothetical protein